MKIRCFRSSAAGAISILLPIITLGCDGKKEEDAQKNKPLVRHERPAPALEPPGLSRRTKTAGMEEAIAEPSKKGELELKLSNIPESARGSELQSLAESAGKRGDSDFLAQALALPPGKILTDAIKAYCRSLSGRQNIESALTVLSGDLLPEEREAAWWGIYGPLGDLNPSDLSDMYKNGIIPAAFDSSEKIAPVIAGSMGNNLLPDAAQAEIANYPEKLRAQMVKTYWRQFSIVNIAGAREALEKGAVPLESRASTAQLVATDMLNSKSYSDTLTYAQGLEEGVSIPMIKHIFDLWSQNDSRAASEKAVALPPGPQLNAAADAISGSLEAVGDKEEAARWRAIKTKQ